MSKSMTLEGWLWTFRLCAEWYEDVMGESLDALTAIGMSEGPLTKGLYRMVQAGRGYEPEDVEYNPYILRELRDDGINIPAFFQGVKVLLRDLQEERRERELREKERRERLEKETLEKETLEKERWEKGRRESRELREREALERHMWRGAPRPERHRRCETRGCPGFAGSSGLCYECQ